MADRWNTDPIPCNTDGYGEAHDYMVSIAATPTCLTARGLSVSNLAPDTATLAWTASVRHLPLVMNIL